MFLADFNGKTPILRPFCPQAHIVFSYFQCVKKAPDAYHRRSVHGIYLSFIAISFVIVLILFCVSRETHRFGF